MKEEEKIKQALSILKNGGIVVVPTETAYALSVDATNADAVERVRLMKGREARKTPPLIVASVEMAEQYLELTPKLRELVEVHWPGPLTIIGRAKKSALAPAVIRADGTIAVRVSSNEVARRLSTELQAPIVSTSANASGQSECYSIESVRKQFCNQELQPDAFFDAGSLPQELPSTIVKEENGNIIVVRQGSVHVF